MNTSRQVILAMLIGALLGLAGSACLAQETEDSGAPGESKPPPKPPRVRKKATIALPDQYRSKDTDHDGQIGLYEWPRSDYASFHRLDLNGDGFLTPQELVNGPSKRKSGEVRSFSSNRRAGGGGSTRRSPSSASSSSEPPVVSTSNVEAERFFDLFDKDKDGKLSEAEFKKSSLLSKKFSDAGVALSFPAGKEEFVRLYPAPKK